MTQPERIVLVTRETRLEALKRRFVTLDQARFYLDRAGQDLGPLETEDRRFRDTVALVRAGIPEELPVQAVGRDLVSSFPFRKSDVVVIVGPDGLVANTVKYALGTPIIAVNPDPDTIEGVLCRTEPGDFAPLLGRLLSDKAALQSLTLAEATTSDGQRLLAVNDLFIGRRDHVSARYTIELGKRSESQSSSGIIVSTGVGSTGWMRSILTGAQAVAQTWGMATGTPRIEPMPWNTASLAYFVREPFPSVGLGVSLVAGLIDDPLKVVSAMPEAGVIFSDGVAADAVEFHSGLNATIKIAEAKGVIVSQ